MSRKWPSWYTGDPNADPNIVLGDIFEKAASFNTGLGISYPLNPLNHVLATDFSGVAAGSRPPDVELTMPGTGRKVRFQDITHNHAKFWVVVLTGEIATTRPLLLELQSFVEHSQRLKNHDSLGWITISASTGCSTYEALGMEPFGATYFDAQFAAHEKLGLRLENGGIVILRPDGLVGSGGFIDGQWVENYFLAVLR